jgi:hypothetical protein
VVTKEQIQALATCGLLKPKVEVAWRPAVGDPIEGIGETVVFLTHTERGFGVPTGDLFRGLLYFYRIDLVHLVPNTITIVSSFIHLCEAYLGILPHFHLWRLLTVKFRQSSHEFTFGVGMNFISYPLVLTPLV